MDLTQRWPILRELCSYAEQFPDLEIWVFGSMLRSDHPRDLDILIIYVNPADVTALLATRLWEVALPVIDIIAMTPDEDQHYRFIESTGARRLQPLTDRHPRAQVHHA